MKTLSVKRKISCILLICYLISLFSFAPSFFSAAADTDYKATGNKKRIMVSMGDSYSSGEGIPDFYGQKDKYGNDNPIETKGENHDWLAHRSTKSWSGRLKLDGVSGKMADHWFNYEDENYDSANWFFVASSGAVTDDLGDPKNKSNYYNGQEKPCDRDGLNTTNNPERLKKQLYIFDELKNRDLDADYVTITIGGNDAEFVNIVTDAITPHPFNPGALNDKLQDVWKRFYNDTTDDYGNKVESIRGRIYDAYNNIHTAAGDQAKIIVAGYPKLFKSNIDIEVKVFNFISLSITKEETSLINDSVTRFNKEINAIVNTCKSEGIRITFVSVEGAFGDNGAYADDPLLNPCYIGETKSEDLKNIGSTKASSYSMHPNNKGAAIYAKCVQEKIDSIEKDDGKSEWPDMTSSDERDVVMVLDASGSMDGKPMEEVVKASEKFVETVLEEEASVGVVAYDNTSLTVCNFCKNKNYLVNSFSKLNAGGGTNIESGLLRAEEMLNKSSAKKKIIVLMSDGVPNNGKVGSYLVDYAKTLREKGIYIYTLGFFSSLSGGEKTNAQDLMKQIAGDESFYFDIDDAENIVYFFGDIADQIRGQKYIYIKIACPVDVTVEYNGETLTSDASSLNKRTSFGSLTLETNTENSEQNEGYDEGEADLVKILRLKNNVDYDISINGTGRGRMDYTIGFMDDNGEYSDTRRFKNIKINRKTVIDTVAAETDTTVLNVDEDGDGKYDYVYEATKNSRGKLVEKSWTLLIVLCVLGFLIIASIGALVIVTKIHKKKNTIPQN